MTSIITTQIGNDVGYVKKGSDTNQGRKVKIVLLDVDATDDSSTFSFDLKDYNLNRLLGIRGTYHTTAYSVLVPEPPTTVLSGTTITVTTGKLGGASKKRSYIIFGEEA